MNMKVSVFTLFQANSVRVFRCAGRNFHGLVSRETVEKTYSKRKVCFHKLLTQALRARILKMASF